MKKVYRNIFLIFSSFLSPAVFSQAVPEPEIQMSADRENGIQVQIGSKNQDSVAAQEEPQNQQVSPVSQEIQESSDETADSIEVTIPAAKRPKTPDSEKVKDLDKIGRAHV